MSRATHDILLNGEPFPVADGATLAELLNQRKPRPPFAVEVNRQLVRRPDYAATPLAPGDRVEIVTLVGGG